MEKLKLLDWNGKEFTICTCLRSPQRLLFVNSKPSIVFYPEHVQVGCVRLTYDFVENIAEVASLLKDKLKGKTLPFVLQKGTYEVKGPTWERWRRECGN